MSDNVLSTRPVNSSEKVLRAKFAEGFAGQSEQMAGLAPRLGLPEGLEGWEQLSRQTGEE